MTHTLNKDNITYQWNIKVRANKDFFFFSRLCFSNSVSRKILGISSSINLCYGATKKKVFFFFSKSSYVAKYAGTYGVRATSLVLCVTRISMCSAAAVHPRHTDECSVFFKLARSMCAWPIE